MPALVPGRILELGDGTEVVVTRADKMPKRWVRYCKQMGHTRLHMVSSWDGVKWRFHDDPPPHALYRGGLDIENEFAEYERYAVCVPTAYFEPETNEFGEVSP